MSQEFGTLLRSFRDKRGLTQRQLADLSTVSVRAIRDLESGRVRRPRPDTARLIADGLGLSGPGRSELESARCGGLRPEAPPLPAPLGALIGRDVECAQLDELLRSGAQRLVTLTGLAGIGKSRLALEVASALRRQGTPVRWQGDGDPASVADDEPHPGHAPAVLVLDGVSHRSGLPEGTARLLGRYPGLRVLCTARAPLGVPGECAVPLEPLALPEGPPSPAALLASPAGALLLHHIRHVRPGFEVSTANAGALTAIVRRLDGVPPALDAAASWFLVYQPADLLAYLTGDPLEFATERLASWLDAVRDTLSGLDAAESALLAQLARPAGAGADRSLAEIVELSGHPAGDCVRLVHRLVSLGLLAGSRAGRFRVLELVRAARRDAAETAAVLPLRLPVREFSSDRFESTDSPRTA